MLACEVCDQLEKLDGYEPAVNRFPLEDVVERAHDSERIPTNFAVGAYSQDEHGALRAARVCAAPMVETSATREVS